MGGGRYRYLFIPRSLDVAHPFSTGIRSPFNRVDTAIWCRCLLVPRFGQPPQNLGADFSLREPLPGHHFFSLRFGHPRIFYGQIFSSPKFRKQNKIE